MNRARSSLRWRVALAFTLLGAVLSLLFASATVLLTEDYEHILVEEITRGQAEDYSLRLTTHPETQLPRTHRLSGYLRRADGSSDAPAGLLALEPGIHENENEEEDGIHVGVFDMELGRFYFVMDLSDIEQIERYLGNLLAAVVLVGTGLSGWLGWVLAGATLAPVRKLAAAVDALPAQPQPTNLAADASADELGRLARAIDRYQARLVEADAAERAFFADASHELRTPMAVVRGAMELLLDEPAADAGTRRRLQRLERGVRELTELLDVLLGLVRRRVSDIDTVDAVELLRACSEAWALTGDPPRLSIAIDGEGTLRVPHREALLILQGVIRRMLPPDPAGRLALRARAGAIELDYHAWPDVAPAREPDAGTRSDRGLGLTLVGRLAEHLGWRIEERATDPARREVRIVLPD